MDYFYLIVGIVILLLSGNWLVKSGSALANYFKIPPFIVGVTVISFGTSAPELFVSLNASLSGFSDIAIGNVVGSNLANIGLVLAITAIIISIPIQRSTIKLDYPVLLISAVLFAGFMLDLTISRIEGAILLLSMLVYILIMIRSVRRDKQMQDECIEEKKKNPLLSVLLLIFSCGGLLLGSNMLVEGAGNIAESLGVSQRIISITVIAFGTSIPELATSVIAAFKKNVDIAVGNIIGSNIFNILVIVGISSLANPLSVNPTILKFDLVYMLGMSVLLGIAFIPFKNPKVTRWKGFVFLAAYFAYYVVLFQN
jgi:cation:H+ antiporter